MNIRRKRNRLAVAMLTAVAFLAAVSEAPAQSWVLPQRVGTVSFYYQRISNEGHRLTDGFLAKGGFSTDMALYVEGEYGITDRLSVSAGIPYVFAKYTDTNPPPPPIPYLPVDQCHCWHSGLADFGFTARYNAVTSENRAFALTPSVSFGLPSHDYDFRGEAVLGRDLKEVRFGIDTGLRLDAISPKLSVQGRYSYAVVEHVLDIGSNRSNANLEGAFDFTRKFSARGFTSWQRTHGGLRLGSMPPDQPTFPGEVNTPELLFQHDRLLRDNNFRLGGGTSYSFERFDVFGSYTAYISGTDTHAGGALTVGISFPFEIGHTHGP
jgi:hypothetical protein